MSALFDDKQLLRYSRQIMLPQFGIEAQQALAASHVLMLGLGGLGSPAALYLATAGVGRLTLVDHDTVELSNLQRQILHPASAIGQAKTGSARQTLRARNEAVRIDCVDHKPGDAELDALIARADCVIDATDNYSSRFQINRLCQAQGTPLVSAAAIRFEGQISVFDFRRDDSPCYACLYPEGGDQAATCSENGILGPVVGIMGCLQALETIKLLTGLGEPLAGRLLLFDALSLQWRTLKLRKDPACPVCRR